MTHIYKVLAATKATGIVAVKDADGRCHVGRALGDVPAPDAELRGECPTIGVRTLQVVHDEAPCPVALVLLDVEPEVAVKLAVTLDPV